MKKTSTIPVIDLFAGPGGLGEGFASFRSSENASTYKAGESLQPFRIALSIEKDPYAHQTLRLRSFFRQFHRDEVPDSYYDVLHQKISISNFPGHLKESAPELFESWLKAEQEAVVAELGASPEQDAVISNLIRNAIGNNRGPWVLIGGPPCQAYSVVGRVRNKGIADYRIEDDRRTTLYRQYLRIIADHWPTVFVMENVKGMLSATADNKSVFEGIISDLQSPRKAFDPSARSRKSQRYRVVPAVQVEGANGHGFDPTDFVVASERYGIPQIRHRVILVGIREDLGEVSLSALSPGAAPDLDSVICDLPKLRSGVSRRLVAGKYVRADDSPEEWIATIRSQTIRNGNGSTCQWLKALSTSDYGVYQKIVEVVRSLSSPDADRGGVYVDRRQVLPDRNTLGFWYRDDRLNGVCNHETRSHMDSDLARYLFASCFAKVHGISPNLSEFPSALMPDHGNADSGHFDDRFRVQLAQHQATTVTSHMSKDGHYFIHPDPTQCRSLTVREAARIQTFPDNYYFCGPRTAQCVQVGNAVPPYLARQIASCVWDLLVKAGKV